MPIFLCHKGIIIGVTSLIIEFRNEISCFLELTYKGLIARIKTLLLWFPYTLYYKAIRLNMKTRLVNKAEQQYATY